MTKKPNPKWPWIVDTTDRSFEEYPGLHVIREQATDRVVALIPIPESSDPRHYDDVARITDGASELRGIPTHKLGRDVVPELWEALNEVMTWIKNAGPEFVLAPEWRQTAVLVERALLNGATSEKKK